MSRKANCWDHAVAENFFKIIKTEMVYHQDFDTYEQAKRAVFPFIESWYHRKRLHSYLGYQSPEAFMNHYQLNCDSSSLTHTG